MTPYSSCGESNFRLPLWLGWFAIAFATQLFGQQIGSAPLRTFSTEADGRKSFLSPPVVSPDGSRLSLEVTDHETFNRHTTVFDTISGQKLLEFAARPSEPKD